MYRPLFSWTTAKLPSNVRLFAVAIVGEYPDGSARGRHSVWTSVGELRSTVSESATIGIFCWPVRMS
jgi:hypothetical protein